jgi:transposase
VTEKLYAALDVSLKKTAVCVIRLVREFEAATLPEVIVEKLQAADRTFETVGLEAGPMSEWLVRGLAERGIEAVLIETRQARTKGESQCHYHMSVFRPRFIRAQDLALPRTFTP